MYPFDDFVKITVNVRASNNIPIYLRIPKWATSATIQINGNSEIPLPSGTMYKVMCNAKAITTMVIDFNPQILVEYGWGYNNSVVVTRGPLVYGLYLTEKFTQLAHYAYNSNDYQILTPDTWNMALLVDSKNSANSFKFYQV